LINLAVIANQNAQTAKLCSELSRHGFQCFIIANNDVIEQIKKQKPDLLLVELTVSSDTEMLCRRLKQEPDLPILIMATPDRIDSFNGYMDDFVIIPCNIKELSVRVKRLIREKEEANGNKITVGNLTIDPEKYEVYVDGRLVSMTFKEYELLKYLAGNPGRVFTRDTLLNRVWGEDYFGGDRTVDVHIRRLRSKIEDSTHTYIDTVRNIGYRFIKN
jgi:DNA-binding response OmpR family regulator